MRSCFLKKHNKLNNWKTEEDTENYRILQDLNKHNWLMKKLNGQFTTSVKNHKTCDKHLVDETQLLKSLKMSEAMYIDDLVIDVEESPEREIQDTPSVTVSIPIHHFNNRENETDSGKRGQPHATSVLKTSDSKIPLVSPLLAVQDSKDVETLYHEGDKDLYKNVQAPDGQFASYNSQSENSFLSNNLHKKVGETNSNNTFIRHINDSENIAIDTLSNMSRVCGSNDQKKYYIKHHLPFPAPPQREKYKMFLHKPVVVNNAAIMNGGNSVRRNSITIISHTISVETQTDVVMFMNEEEKNILGFIKANNITVEQIKKHRLLEHRDAETNTELAVTVIEPGAKANAYSEELVSMLVACSEFNKELIFKYGVLPVNGLPKIDASGGMDAGVVARLAHMRKLIQKICESSSTENSNTTNNDESRLDAERAIEENKSATKRQRLSSVPTLPQPDYTSTGNQVSPVVTQQLLAAKKTALRAQRKPQTRPLQMYPPLPQYEQYPQRTEMAVEPHLINANVPDNRMHMPQYQCTRSQQAQVPSPGETSFPYHNSGPRMMHPYAVQFTRKQQSPFVAMGDTWNYPQQYPDRTQNAQSHNMNGDPMSTRVRPQPPSTEQQMYRQMEIQRNAVHMSNYAGTDWNTNMRQNGPM